MTLGTNPPTADPLIDTIALEYPEKIPEHLDSQNFKSGSGSVFSKGTGGSGKGSKSVGWVGKDTGLPLVLPPKRKVKLLGKVPTKKEVIAKLGGKRWKLDMGEYLGVDQVDKDGELMAKGKKLGRPGAVDVKNYPYSMLYKICNKDSEQRMSLNEFDNYCSFVKTKLFL